MKKSIAFILLSTVLFTYSDKCHAQFLKKLGQSIEKVSKQVDDVLKTETSTTDSPKIAVTTPHKNLKVNLLNATYNGDEFLLEFTITNTGEDIKGYCLMDGSSEKTIAFDNEGNQCRVTLLFGNVRSKNNGYAENTLLSGVPVKVIVSITKFGVNASSFPQIKIGAGTDIWNITNYFTFKNIPIEKEKEQEVAIPVKEAVPVNNSISSTTVNIPKLSTNGTYGQLADMTRITDAERALFKIDDIESQCGSFNNKWKNNLLAINRKLFQGEKPMLITLIFINDHPNEGIITSEYLVSYDKQGNFSDCIVIAEKWPPHFSKVRWDSVIEGNKVTVHVVDKENDYENWNSYQITPELKFKL